jgi:organic radical activating enzyme
MGVAVVTLPRQIGGPDAISYDIRDYPFGIVLTTGGEPRSHCDLEVLRRMSSAQRVALLSALHESAGTLTDLLTSPSEHVNS